VRPVSGRPDGAFVAGTEGLVTARTVLNGVGVPVDPTVVVCAGPAVCVRAGAGVEGVVVPLPVAVTVRVLVLAGRTVAVCTVVETAVGVWVAASAVFVGVASRWQGSLVSLPGEAAAAGRAFHTCCRCGRTRPAGL
jgi:hypothetical protein